MHSLMYLRLRWGNTMQHFHPYIDGTSGCTVFCISAFCPDGLSSFVVPSLHATFVHVFGVHPSNAPSLRTRLWACLSLTTPLTAFGSGRRGHQRRQPHQLSQGPLRY